MDRITWYCLLAVNVVAFLAYVWDKQKAIRGDWRISEKTLLGLAICGGSYGAWIGMKVAHHKTQKPVFAVGVPVIVAFETAAIVWVSR